LWIKIAGCDAVFSIVKGTHEREAIVCCGRCCAGGGDGSRGGRIWSILTHTLNNKN